MGGDIYNPDGPSCSKFGSLSPLIAKYPSSKPLIFYQASLSRVPWNLSGTLTHFKIYPGCCFSPWPDIWPRTMATFCVKTQTVISYLFTVTPRKILKKNLTKPWACQFKWHWVTLKPLEPYIASSGSVWELHLCLKGDFTIHFWTNQKFGKTSSPYYIYPFTFSLGDTHWLFLRNMNILCLVGNKLLPSF